MRLKKYLSNNVLVIYFIISSLINSTLVRISMLDSSLGIKPFLVDLGVITFILSVIGTKVGNRFGDKYENKAEFIGGVILILLGLKILLEHLGMLNF